MDCGENAITVVLPDDTAILLPHAVLSLSPMLSSLEGLFADREAFRVPPSAGLSVTGLSLLSDFITRHGHGIHHSLPTNWPSEEAAEFLRAASFFDVQDAVEAAAATMASRLLECQNESEVHILATGKIKLDEMSVPQGSDDDVQDLIALCPTLGLRGLVFAKLSCARHGLLPLFSMDFLRTVLQRAERDASEEREVQELRRGLSRSGRGSLRRKRLALEDIACARYRGSSTIIALVIEYSQDQESEVRASCMQSLSELVPRDDTPDLNDSISTAVRLLCDASTNVRRAAVNALLSWSPLGSEALSKLEHLVRQKSGRVKAAAVEAMSSSVQGMPTQRILLLLSCLEDVDEQVQTAAGLAFGSYSKHALDGGNMTAVVDLADAIADKLQSRRQWVKCAAAASLQKILQDFKQPHEKAKNSLLVAFADSNSVVRSSVVQALPYVAPDEVSQTLVMALQDPDSTVRFNARKGLVMITNKSNWKVLAQRVLELIDSSISHTRCVVLETLNQILRKTLLSIMPNDLGNFLPQDESFLSLMTSSLCPRLMDTDGYVRIAAARTIGCYTEVFGKNEDFADPLARVAAEDDDDDVKAAALKALATAAEIGDLRATDVAVLASKHPSAEVRRQALSVLCTLVPFACDQVERVLSAVCARISDSNDQIRRFAMEALPEIIQGDDSAGTTAVRALGAVARRRSSSDQMAVCALESIACVARLGGPKTKASAMSPVAACLRDENWIVREAAENAACTMNISVPAVTSPSFVHSIHSFRRRSGSTSSSSVSVAWSPSSSVSRSRSRSKGRKSFRQQVGIPVFLIPISSIFILFPNQARLSQGAEEPLMIRMMDSPSGRYPKSRVGDLES